MIKWIGIVVIVALLALYWMMNPGTPKQTVKQSERQSLEREAEQHAPQKESETKEVSKSATKEKAPLKIKTTRKQTDHTQKIGTSAIPEDATQPGGPGSPEALNQRSGERIESIATPLNREDPAVKASLQSISNTAKGNTEDVDPGDIANTDKPDVSDISSLPPR